MFDLTCFNTDGEIITHLTQWDVGQCLVVDSTDLNISVAPIFHFCNKNSTEALVVVSSIDDSGMITVAVPNSLLREPYPLIAYIYVYNTDISVDSAKTLATIKIPVRKRIQPSDYEYVENIDYVSAAQIEAEIATILARISNVDNTADADKSVSYATTAGTADTATQLATATRIDGVYFDGSTHINHLGSCTTAAATVAKTTTLKAGTFALVGGARIAVFFEYGNTAENATLNVSGTGAKLIYYQGSPVPSGYIKAHGLYEFIYGGSYWHIVGQLSAEQIIDGVGFDGTTPILHFASCNTGGATQTKGCTIKDSDGNILPFTLMKGSRVAVWFQYTNTATEPYLNISSSGAQPIRYKGAAVPAGYIQASNTYEFVYDGSYWRLIGDLADYRVGQLEGTVDEISETVRTLQAAVTSSSDAGIAERTDLDPISIETGDYYEINSVIPYETVEIQHSDDGDSLPMRLTLTANQSYILSLNVPTNTNLAACLMYYETNYPSLFYTIRQWTGESGQKLNIYIDADDFSGYLENGYGIYLFINYSTSVSMHEIDSASYLRIILQKIDNLESRIEALGG